MLKTLEDVLQTRVYLVGDKITLADIMVGVFVSRGLAWILDAKWRSAHPNIMKHFEMVADWKHVKAVIPIFVLIREETPNLDPNR